jgi:acetyl-CoA acetyltransferase
VDDVYLIGSWCSAFGKRPETGFKALTREAVLGALADAGLADGGAVEQVWFGNVGMAAWGQGGIRGQVCLSPLVEEGLLPPRVPVVNVESGCATASLALHGAWKDVLSGECDFALAVGVEKLASPDRPERVAAILDTAIDQLDPQRWRDYYAQAGAAAGKSFETGPGRSLYMDTYAMQAAWHMRHHGTTQRQIAAGAAKNHAHGALNPKAQYRFAMTVDEVLADRPVSWPLTRAMCAPIGDGAAAALLCSGAALARCAPAVRERAVRVRACALASGIYRALDAPGLSSVAARRAYERAGLAPDDVDVVELHDATAFSEIFQLEMLGFCAPGAGGPLVESGATALDGRLPVNLSGGLVSKGHPIGATGLSMIDELVLQLRGEAGPRQARGARIGLAENGGGVMGFDEAACAVTLLEKA